MGLLGSAPNQVPTNADLGSMAYQDSSSVSTGLIANAGNISSNTFTENTYPVVTQKDIGTNSNQVPLNQYLGRIAYQDYATAIEQNTYLDTNTSTVIPTLSLDFVNSKTLDSRITFTRNSSALAYDNYSSAVAEQNLLSYSQLIGGTGWAVGSASIVTNNATAPDGTLTASTLTITAQFGGVYQVQPLTSGVTYTFSCYMQSVSGNTSINLQLGGNVSGSQTITTSWARYTYTFTAGSTGSVNCYPAIDRNASGQPTVINIWGAQLEQRSSVTAYNVTTTSTITNYIPTLQTYAINAPRIDYDPVTRFPLGLLIEQSSTNLVYPSGTLNSWPKGGNGATTASSNISPDGTQNATLLNAATTGTDASIYQFVTTTAQSYTLSIYAKQAGKTIISLSALDAGASYPNAYFNLATGVLGTVTNSTATITSVGNGWYRCTMTYTASASTNPMKFFVCDANGSTTSTASGTNGIYIWGAQLEALAFPTSYIPTTSVALARGVESASITGTNFSSWYNAAQGTAYIDAIYGNTSGVSGGFTFSGTSLVNGYWQVYASTSNQANGLISGSYVNLNIGQPQLNTSARVAFSVSNSIWAASSNGGTVSTSLGNIPQNMNSLYLGGSNQGNSFILNGRIRKFAYYPTALSSAELQEITS
jgi:hypothetical protein